MDRSLGAPSSQFQRLLGASLQPSLQPSPPLQLHSPNLSRIPRNRKLWPVCLRCAVVVVLAGLLALANGTSPLLTGSGSDPLPPRSNKPVGYFQEGTLRARPSEQSYPRERCERARGGGP